MKRAFLLIMCCMLAVFIAGCGSFSPPILLPDPPISGDGPSTGPAGGDETYDDMFTVTLVSGGKPYYPTEEIFAQWTGAEGTHRGLFNSQGIARMPDLDGEYHVTLSSLPYGYTYDPNGYFVDNTKPDVTIELLQIVQSVDSEDTALYRCINIQDLGTYRCTLTSHSHQIFFQYQPQAGGRYSIQSWVDTTANEVNPYVSIYNGTFAFKLLDRVQNDGGAASTYTKNFRFDIALQDYEVQNVWTFAIRADSITDNYPVTVDFTIAYEGELPNTQTTYESVNAVGPFNATGDNYVPSGGDFTYIYHLGSYGGVSVPDFALNEKIVKLNPEDGYYHLWDERNQEYGSVLFASLTRDFAPILETDSGQGFLDPLVNLRLEGYDYYDFMTFYSYYTDAEGRHPVTEELKTFLYRYSRSQRFFNDGNGWAEEWGLQSGEDSQWLFACGVYS